MDSIVSFSNVFYPPMGVVHITHDLGDLFTDKIKGKEKIIIRTSSQPNSTLHLGTVTTIMTCYAIAEYLMDKFHICTEILFDALENSPAETLTINNIVYQICLMDKFIDNQPVYQKHLENFKNVFDFLTNVTNINVTIRRYLEFQQMPVVRKNILKIINNHAKFVPIISPSDRQLHIRFPCPVCNLIDKASINTKIKLSQLDLAQFDCYCPNHGIFSVNITETNSQFIDANTSIRDILQGVISLENNNTENTLSIMVDGSDWGNVWALHVFCQGLLLLGYNEIPPRLFAPLILDWSGAKFSKSLYLHSDAYKFLPQGFVDFSKFMAVYGIEGLEKLWNEVRTWSRETKKLFRNYSTDYLRLILNS